MDYSSVLVQEPSNDRCSEILILGGSQLLAALPSPFHFNFVLCCLS